MLLPIPIKNKILSTYATNKGDIELEARFGLFKKHSFSPGVTRQIFNRVKAYFDLRASRQDIKTTDYIMGRVRKSVISPIGEDKAEIVWITKNRLWNEQLKDYGIRYSMSSEIPISPVEPFTPELIREKNRSSYFVFDNSVKIDLTLVSTSKTRVSQDDVTYEIEIELLNPKRIDSFEKAIRVTLGLILDTIVLYTEALRNKVINEINFIINSKKRGMLDHYPLVQARNLKMRDMVFGGLIGNEETGYSVTHKADGQRKLLFFSEDGIWLASAPTSLSRISDKAIPGLRGTIIDGEMIPEDKRLEGAPKTRIWYLAFDALAWNRDSSIRNEPHGKRMWYAQSVADKMKSGLITVNTKSFKNISTPQEFFSTMREMFREQLVLTYKQDGFMFTPQNTVYNPHSDRNPLFKRVLTKFPDICKWKPKEELTIDFSIKWRADPSSSIGKTLELYSSIRGKPKLFEEKVDQLSNLTFNLPNNTIVEYGYDYEKKMLVPHRVRHDKIKPNKEEIALDVWADITNPIEKETLEGNTFTLMRRYHNRIKRQLFDSALNKDRPTTLLDIGSGRGGDVYKWKNFDRIVAVEPNSEHIKELRRRLEEANMSNKVYILQAGGQETEKITNTVNEWIGDQVDVVSSMLSMTFFWQSASLVKSLMNTIVRNIKSAGKFIFLTMDGDLVEQTFEPAFQTGLVLNKLELGNATLKYFGDKKPKELHIDIKDSIVTDQVEWLVRLDDISEGIKPYVMDYSLLKKADEEKFLTEEEITLTQMYSYGMMEIGEFFSPATPEYVPISNEDEELDFPKLPVIPISPEKLPPLQVPKKEEVKKEEVLPPLKTPPPLQTPLKIPPPLQPPKALPPLKTPPPLVPPKKEVLPVKKEKELDMIPVDSVETVNLDWWKERVVRIGSIGDGSCFFHSVFNAYLKIYQTNPDVQFRKEFVQNFRRDVSIALSSPDPKFPEKTLYETSTQFLNLYEQQLLGLNVKDLMGVNIDFSKEGLAKFFNSSNYVGDETYKFVADLLNIDIYVMRLTDKNLYVHLATGEEKRSVVISGNGYHFETIGIEREGLYQTFFEPTDPFILKIK